MLHVWVQRAKCSCGYLWTTPGSPNVNCRCTKSSIVDNNIVAGDSVTNEVEFRAAVCADLGVQDAELDLQQANP